MIDNNELFIEWSKCIENCFSQISMNLRNNNHDKLEFKSQKNKLNYYFTRKSLSHFEWRNSFLFVKILLILSQQHSAKQLKNFLFICCCCCRHTQYTNMSIMFNIAKYSLTDLASGQCTDVVKWKHKTILSNWCSNKSVFIFVSRPSSI